MFELLAEMPLLFVAVMAVTGLVVGSFLNVLIYRLPIMLQRQWQAECAEFLDLPRTAEDEPFDLMRPPSHCPHCRRPVRAIENIPVLSYVFLRGRCAGCGRSISLRYPLIELAAGLGAAVAAWRFGAGAAALGAAGLSWALIALSVIDYDHKLLPDLITLPMLWLGVLLNINAVFVPLPDAVIGACAGYLALWAVYWAFKLLTGKEGMAAGDFKLLAMLGAWLGWQQLPLVILLSSAIGAVAGLALLAFTTHGRDQPIPFGPYLAAAGWVAMYWGSDITAAYLGAV